MMKGMLKRCLGVVAAAAMAVTGMAALTGTANAAGSVVTGNKVTFTFTADNQERLANANLTAYKIADYVQYGTEDSAKYAVQTNEENLYAVAAAMQTIYPNDYNFNEDGDPMMWALQPKSVQDSSAYLDQSTSEDDSWIHVDDGNGGVTAAESMTRKLANELAGLIGDEDTPLNSTTPVTFKGPESANGKWQITVDLDPGIWLFVDSYTGEPAEGAENWGQSVPMILYSGELDVDNKAVKNPFKAGAGATSVLKNEATPIQKTVNTDAPSIGDAKEYTILSEVPNWSGKTGTSFKFTDTPGVGQTIDYSSIQVSIGRYDEVDPFFSMTPIDPENYSVTQFLKNTESDVYRETIIENDNPAELVADGKSHFVIDLTEYMKDAAVNPDLIGMDVVVTYNVIINSDAATGDDITNNIKVDNDGSSAESNTTINGSHVFKIGKTQGDKETPLAGAGFTIYDEHGEVLHFDKTKENIGTEDDPYYEVVYTYNENGMETELITPSSGYFKVQGLGMGSYKVTETTTPEGYWEMEPSFVVNLNADDGDSWDSEIGSINTTDDKFGLVFYANRFTGFAGLEVGVDTREAVSVPAIGVMNINNITQLPLTGAAGITMFVVLGLLIAGVGVTVYVKSRGVRNALRG